ncbi:MAG: macro domain-containing protein [Bacillota bacterium]|nr:macro domain-containing protein [Bacillota bacterium]
MPLEIIRNDITKVHADAIVNAASTSLQQGGGVCGAIFAAAGSVRLQAACDAIGGCAIGEAVITPGYDLPSAWIIHAVGPVWHDGQAGEAALLADAYRNALLLAKAHQLESIAFPLISTGIYQYPKDQALQIAIATIGAFLLENDMTVYLVVYDKASFVLSERLFASITEYIDDTYVDAHPSRRREQPGQYKEAMMRPELKPELDANEQSCAVMQSPVVAEDEISNYTSITSVQRERRLDDLLDQLDETFSQMLLRLIDEKVLSDVTVYKRANIDRRLFSKIRSDVQYKASKSTALAFAIALELSLDETRDLLSKAGFALSHSNKFDIIIEYFIQEGNYNIFEINEALFAFDQALLGA